VADSPYWNSDKIASLIGEVVQSMIPPSGLLEGRNWRIGTAPFLIPVSELSFFQKLGLALLEFYRAANLLYRWSFTGKAPKWIAEWLDRGKPKELIQLQRSKTFKNELPRIIRPDVLLGESGYAITELDAVPGGIGLTDWLNRVYYLAAVRLKKNQPWQIIGGPDGMTAGFRNIFTGFSRIWIMISEECATYQPEMKWLAKQLGESFVVTGPDTPKFTQGEAVYRFFELFDLENVPGSLDVFTAALKGQIYLTPPPKPALEEKMLLALFWNANLRDFWKAQLGEKTWTFLSRVIPRTWVIDPTPLPPWVEIPELGITAWEQLADFSQKQRELVLKVSGFSPMAWGARGVYVGHDLPKTEWERVVKTAIQAANSTPFVLQRFVRSRRILASWFDTQTGKIVYLEGRVRLCPYYFVSGQWDNPTVTLGGILATICPADKKVIHGMSDSILVPVAVSPMLAANTFSATYPNEDRLVVQERSQ